MIKLVQVIRANQKPEYYLREVNVNPNHIVSMSPSDEFIVLLHQDKLPEGLDNNHEFIEINFSNGKTIIAVGTVKLINERISDARKLLLG